MSVEYYLHVLFRKYQLILLSQARFMQCKICREIVRGEKTWKLLN